LMGMGLSPFWHSSNPPPLRRFLRPVCVFAGWKH
jgi:hypothetical protein